MKLEVINSPFNEQQVKLLNELIPNLTAQQRIWLNGYLSAPFAINEHIKEEVIEAVTAVEKKTVTFLYASQTGNAQRLAEKFAAQFNPELADVSVVSMGSFKVNQIKKLDYVFIVASTHGEGEPPDNAIGFHEFLYSKRAPQLPHVKYSVLAIGDSSYEFFCKTGIDFDERFEALGAQRIAPRVDCDLDYDQPAEAWFKQVAEALETTSGSTSAPQQQAAQASESTSQYSRSNPFYAEVLEKINLNGRGSNKETNHLEISLEGSGLTYEPGDSLAIYPTNDEALVDLLLTALTFDATTTVTVNDEQLPLKQALVERLDFTALSSPLLKKVQQYTSNEQLAQLVENKEQLKQYIYGRDLVDVVNDFGPYTWDAQQFVSILRKNPARLYSISSSNRAYPEEVHLTIGKVAYEKEGRARLGVASGQISERLQVGEQLPVYVQSNTNFRLPANDETPIIMIGAGTGVAPYRAFLQEREERGAQGDSWLFFGDQHFVTDFLYQTEWQGWLNDGILSNLTLAFSRDSKEKVYVQHRLLENAKEVYEWLQKGAYVYVCGDEKAMAADVHSTLIEIVKQQGNVSEEEATQYVAQLKADKRYQRDVY